MPSVLHYHCIWPFCFSYAVLGDDSSGKFYKFLQVRIPEEVDQVIKGLDLACSPTDPCRTRMFIGVGSACLQLSFLSRETSSCLVKFTLHFLFVSRAIHSTPRLVRGPGTHRRVPVSPPPYWSSI